jgi:hypothetical protein
MKWPSRGGKNQVKNTGLRCKSATGRKWVEWRDSAVRWKKLSPVPLASPRRLPDKIAKTVEAMKASGAPEADIDAFIKEYAA